MTTRYVWSVDDEIAGLIEHVLTVDDETGRGTLSLNGQGHLPIAPEDVALAINRQEWEKTTMDDFIFDRNAIAERWCREHGKDRGELTLADITAIRALPEWQAAGGTE